MSRTCGRWLATWSRRRWYRWTFTRHACSWRAETGCSTWTWPISNACPARIWITFRQNWSCSSFKTRIRWMPRREGSSLTRYHSTLILTWTTTWSRCSRKRVAWLTRSSICSIMVLATSCSQNPNHNWIRTLSSSHCQMKESITWTWRRLLNWQDLISIWR